MSSFFRSFKPIFTPPFTGLALVVVLYYAWAQMVYPHNDMWRGDFPDTDDYMYMAQVLDWLKGQGWYDNIQHRLNPPEGTPIHFSRLAQIPLAASVLFFERLGLKPIGAATLTALLTPLIYLGLCLYALRRVAAHFVPRRWAGASAYVGMFSSGLLFMFAPGHVDHHGLVIVLVLLALDGVFTVMQEPRNYLAALWGGFWLALATVIALEILPWVLLISTALGLYAVAKGKDAARGGLLFALSLFLTSVAGLALTRLDFFTPDVLTYSFAYVLLMGGIAVVFAGVFLADLLTWSSSPRRQGYIFSERGADSLKMDPRLRGDDAFNNARKLHVRSRLAIALVLTGICAALFLHRFPDLLRGPYGAIDAQLTRIILDQVSEAKPALSGGNSWLRVLAFVSSTFIAVPFALWSCVRASGLRDIVRRKTGGAPLPLREGLGERAIHNPDVWTWLLLTTLLITSMLLTLFYQYRFLGFMVGFAVVPLTVLLYQGWQWARSNLNGRTKVFAEIGLLLLVGPLPAVILPALFDSRSFNTGMLLFPVDSARDPCDMYQVEHILRDPATYGDHPRLIVSGITQGPELLFRTPHSVLSAPFHMDVSGNVDATRFFSTPYMEEAERIARRRGIDLVVTCRLVPDFYLRSPNPGAEDKFVRNQGSHDFAPHMAERLLTGQPPAWLKPIDAPNVQNYLLYEVKPSDAAAPQMKKTPRK